MSNTVVALAFNVNTSLTWLFQGNIAAAITGPGTYNFSQTQLSFRLAPSTIFNPTGRLVLQQLSAPPVIFRYTETWNATQNTPGASFYYDSPVFLSAFLSLSGTAINPIQLLAPGAVPSNNQFFGVGGNVAQAIRTSTRCRQNLPDPSQSPQSRTLPSRLLSVAGRVCAPPASITIIRAAKGVARRVDGAESRRRFLG